MKIGWYNRIVKTLYRRKGIFLMSSIIPNNADSKKFDLTIAKFFSLTEVGHILKKYRRTTNFIVINLFFCSIVLY